MAERSPAQPKARAALVRWMADRPRERSQSAVGRALGLSQTSIKQWVKGWARPDVAHREALELLTEGKVKAAEWELLSEKRERQRVLQRLRPMAPTT